MKYLVILHQTGVFRIVRRKKSRTMPRWNYSIDSDTRARNFYHLAYSLHELYNITLRHCFYNRNDLV